MKTAEKIFWILAGLIALALLYLVVFSLGKPMLWFLIGITLLGIGYSVPFMLAFRAQQKENKHLLATGAESEAVITGYQTRATRYAVYHYVQYQFTAASGNQIDCTKRIGQYEQEFPAGTQVKVRYMPQYPSISILLPYAKTQIPS
jgi:hypothetical protein